MNRKFTGAAPRVLWAVYGATVAAMLLFSIMPGGRVWGLNWYRFIPWYGWLLAAVAVVALPLGLARKSHSNQASGRAEVSDNARFWLAAAGIAGLSLVAWVVLAARTHFLGDGYLLLSRLESSAVPIRPWNLGSYFVVDKLYAALGKGGAEGAELVYRLVSYASGLLFLGCAALAAARLFKSTRDRLLFFGGLATGGYALLFFGYVENYPLFATLVGATALLGLLATAGRIGRLWILVPTVLAPLFHPYAAALVPGVLFVLLRDGPVSRRFSALPKAVKLGTVIATGAAIAAAALWAYSSSTFLQLSLLPLTTNRFTVEGYTLFSVNHLSDIANLLWMLAPGFGLLIWLLYTARGKRLLSRPEYVFLFVLLVPCLLIAFVFDPKLGMPRDWDMFAFAGVPLTVLLLYGLLDSRIVGKVSATAAALAIALGVLNLVPRAVTQVLPDTSIAVFDSYSDLDKIRSTSGRFVLLQYLKKEGRLSEKAEREQRNAYIAPYEVWESQGQRLFREGKIDEAEAKFRQAIRYAPNYAYSWADLGVCFAKRQQWDSALAYLEIANGLNPFNSDTYNSMGFALLNLGDSARGEQYCLDALRLKPTNFTARGNLTQLYARQNRRQELIALLVGIVALDSVPQGHYFDAADQLLRLDATDAAVRVCRRALETGADSSLITSLQKKYPDFRLGPTE